jgi:orotidine-5'-phosphate decarboxylase
MTPNYFADQLVSQIKEKKSIICVGLDPRIGEKNSIPSFILENTESNDRAIWEFNKAIIDETINITPVYKPQMAFYEQYNAIDALKQTIDYIHEKGSLVILDAKRNDIGSTSLAYAKTVFDNLNTDAVTVNSYFGIDGVLPFMDYIKQGKGVILLLKTSNKSSIEFQDLFSFSMPEISPNIVSLENLSNSKTPTAVRNYIQMARLMKKWAEDPSLVGKDFIVGTSGYSSLGGVVGATFPEQMKAIRDEIKNHFILIPGYGAQGGKAEDILHGLNSDGLGAVVNASRSIDFAYQNKAYSDLFKEEEFGKAAGQAALDMKEDINKVLEKAGKIAY